MNQKIWQKLWIFFDKSALSSLLNQLFFFSKKWLRPLAWLFLGVFPLKSTKSDCGVGGRAGLDYSFFHAENFDFQSEYAPYLLGYGIVADYQLLNTRDASYDDNIGEWRSRFCQSPDSGDIEEFVYESKIDELAEVRQAVQAKKGEEPLYSLDKNTFALALVENRCLDVVDYLIFAKRCEPYCVIGELWSEKPKDVAQMFFLINQGRLLFKNTDSHFLKVRYAYQMIRLAHYAKDYLAVLKLYDDLVPKIETQKVKSIINYWILAHKAGALKAIGKRAEAAYLFAVVFRFAPSKRQQAFESFDVKDEVEWRQCLNFCRTNEERAALYAIRASYDKAKALQDLIELHRLEPKNEHLSMLLVRETLRLEKVLLGQGFRRRIISGEVIQKNMVYCAALRDFVRRAADENQVKNPTFWRMTEGYLTLLLGSWQDATRVFAKARLNNKDATLAEQIDAFDLAARITGMERGDTTTERLAFSLRTTDAYVSDANFEDFFYEKMGSLYRKSQDKGVAFLCDYQLNDLEKNPKMDLIDNLIALCQKPNKTLFERELTLNGAKTIESVLWNIKGKLHLSRHELEAAAECFKNVPKAELGKKYLPFFEKINDCVNCVQSDTVMVNRAEFVDKMLALEYRARAALDDVAPAYFQLGLGFYNITYFGNSSGLIDAYRSGVSWKYLNSGRESFELSGFPYGNQEVLDMVVARDYFEKARQLSSDREFQARCAFWCSKCEQNMFFTDMSSRYNLGGKTPPNVTPQYRRYFKLLREHYGDTKFFRQAASECKYFGFYVSH